jgi:copper(I)-binding protein
MPSRTRSRRVAGPAIECSAFLAAVIACTTLMYLAAAMPAGHAADAGLTLSDAWIRVIVPSRPAAGYFTLENASDQARVLIGASSAACGSMLHQSRTENGVEKMVMVKSVTVAAHGSLEFAPRGYHLMCMSPSPDLKPGQAVDVTLTFEDGASLTGPFAVQGATGQ